MSLSHVTLISRFRPSSRIACLALATGVLTGCGQASDGRAGLPGSDGGSAVTEGLITAPDGTRLYYRQIGEGSQVVVIPVGFYLEEALSPLAKPGRRLIFYDPRGRGRSDAVDTSRVSLDHQVSDLEALRQSLGIERMALIGWSGLGMEMVVYALRHPDRVTRLVQVAPVAARDKPYNERAYAERQRRLDPSAVRRFRERRDSGEFEGDPAALCRASSELSLPASFADSAHVSAAPDVCIYPNEWSTNLEPYFAALLGSFQGYDWRQDLDSLRVPRLVIHGAADAFPLEGSREWVAGYPDARLILLENAGHFLFLERGEAFFPAVDRFLDGEWPREAIRVSRSGSSVSG